MEEAERKAERDEKIEKCKEPFRKLLKKYPKATINSAGNETVEYLIENMMEVYDKHKGYAHAYERDRRAFSGIDNSNFRDWGELADTMANNMEYLFQHICKSCVTETDIMTVAQLALWTTVSETFMLYLCPAIKRHGIEKEMGEFCATVVALK